MKSSLLFLCLCLIFLVTNTKAGIFGNRSGGCSSCASGQCNQGKAVVDSEKITVEADDVVWPFSKKPVPPPVAPPVVVVPVVPPACAPAVPACANADNAEAEARKPLRSGLKKIAGKAIKIALLPVRVFRR